MLLLLLLLLFFLVYFAELRCELEEYSELRVRVNVHCSYCCIRHKEELAGALQIEEFIVE